MGVGTASGLSHEIETELVRKSLHMLIALVPSIAAVFGVGVTLALLASGTLFFAYCETMRLSGHRVAVVSAVTSMASRQRDIGRFALGPVTLGLGAMAALLLYPNPAASLAIYALAFGDGFASLFGKVFGRTTIPGSRGKTVEGTIACFSAIYLAGFLLTGRPIESAAIAAAGAMIELAPIDDLDNLFLPVGTGLLTTVLFL
ncbi:MAG: phosphatidate cytidylyltransferase [Spirochaetaceae bacterium]|nr:MAG: phosphatidate cytidylyltransferase [Spirochaetaceae bacterium]